MATCEDTLTDLWQNSTLLPHLQLAATAWYRWYAGRRTIEGHGCSIAALLHQVVKWQHAGWLGCTTEQLQDSAIAPKRTLMRPRPRHQSVIGSRTAADIKQPLLLRS